MQIANREEYFENYREQFLPRKGFEDFQMVSISKPRREDQDRTGVLSQFPAYQVQTSSFREARDNFGENEADDQSSQPSFVIYQTQISIGS